MESVIDSHNYTLSLNKHLQANHVTSMNDAAQEKWIKVYSDPD